MLTLDRLGRTVAGRTLFREITWAIHAGDRYGLVGPNGCGKTTLLRIIAGFDEADEGFVHRGSGLRVAYLPQEVEAELPPDASILEAALMAADEVRRLGRECDELAEAIADAAAVPGDEERVHRLTEAFGEKRALFEWSGGDGLEARARIVLTGLGFVPAELERAVRTFSGGWRMRALMARMLLSGADVLLLDEPTNHLDLDALAWLESHLAASPAALVVVSHDRVFLDRVATRVADMVRGTLRITKGGYTEWQRVRTAERAANAKKDALLARDETKLTRFVERFGAKATKAAAAKDKARLLAGVQDERAAIEVDPSWGWRFRWPDPPHSHELLIKLEHARKRYGEKTVLDDVSLEIRRGERWAVMGPNGAGKTTLLRLLTGALPLDGGTRAVHRGSWSAASRSTSWRRWTPRRPCSTTRCARCRGAGRRRRGVRSARSASASCRWSGRSGPSPAASGRGSRWRGWCCGRPRCCCSTSRPTTSTCRSARRSSRRWRPGPGHCSWSATTAPSCPTSRPACWRSRTGASNGSTAAGRSGWPGARRGARRREGRPLPRPAALRLRSAAARDGARGPRRCRTATEG